MKEHEDHDMPSVEKSSVIVDSTAVDEVVTGRVGGGEGITEGFMGERDEGKDMMVDVVGADAVDLGSKEGSVQLVEECMQKETETHDLNMDMEETAGSCEDVSTGSKVLIEKIEATVNVEGLKRSVEVSRDDLQDPDVDAQKSGTCIRDSEMAFESSKEDPQFGGGDSSVKDSTELIERGLTEEVMEQHVESVEEVADGDHVMDRETKKEAEILDSSKTTTANLDSQEIDMIVVEEGFDGKDEAKDSVSMDPSLVCANNQSSMTELVDVGIEEVAGRSKEESLHPTIEVVTDDSQGNTSREPHVVGGENDLTDREEESERGLPKEIMEQPMECDQQVADGDCVLNEKIGKESEALDSSKILEPLTATNPGSEDVDVVVVEEDLASKDEAQDGVFVDPSLVCADNRSSSTNAVNSATSESDVIAQAENLDQQAEVDKLITNQSFHPTTEVITNDAQNPENGTGVADSKAVVESSGGEPQFIGETAVIDREETEKGLTKDQVNVEQHTESVQEVTYGDGVMDEKTGKGDELLDSSKIPESLTIANVGPEEVLTTNIEAQDSDSVGPRLVCPDNRNLPTENSDLQAEVDTMSKDESMHPTAEIVLCTKDDEVAARTSNLVSDGSEKSSSVPPDKVPTALVSTPKPSFKVGECIQRVASQLTGPPSVMKSNSDPNGQHVDQLVGPAISLQIPENSQRETTIVESKQSSVAQMLSQLHLVAQDPMKGYIFLNTIKPFFYDHRAVGRAVSGRKRKTSNENEPEEFEFDDVNDSYWTDRIVQNHSEEQLLQDNQNGGQEHHAVAYEPDKPAKANRRSNKKRFMFSNHVMGLKEQSELVERRRQNLATEVVLKFPEGIYFPSEIHLNKMFRRFGSLMESETEVDRQNGRARVVFKKCCDAEVAHSSAGKFNIFGSINVNYELNYAPLVSYKPLLPSMLQDPMDAS